MLYYINKLVKPFQAFSRFFSLIFVCLCTLLIPFILQAQTPETKKSVVKNIKPRLIAKLPQGVSETSGLVFFNKMLWTINDSGNPAEIYQLDTLTGEILRTVVVRNAVNIDWEAITHDDSNLYIGDFGNNFGTRTDLHILKIPKSALLNTENDTVEAGFIRFHYPDQASFTRELNNNKFDCEAFFFLNDSLHLFSKNWADINSRHYTIAVDTGTFAAQLIEQLEVDGLITDASINEKGTIILLGYKKTDGRQWRCFCWLFAGTDSGRYADTKKVRIELGKAYHLGQTEGIFLNNDKSAWLSAESINAGKMLRKARLYCLHLDAFLDF